MLVHVFMCICCIVCVCNCCSGGVLMSLCCLCLCRYKFLAFDFDETVDMTKDNCRLLLIRLKMEGWMIGKTKVFLKYYNVEFLSRYWFCWWWGRLGGRFNAPFVLKSFSSRLYETQVKKIVKVQSMMRAFLAKRNVASKLIKFRQDSGGL